MRLPLAASVLLVAVAVATAAGAQSCLDGKDVIEASEAEDEYEYTSPGQGVDAAGVAWEGVSGHALHLIGRLGKDEACFAGGEVRGPYDEGSVYECSSKHCPDHVCPEPCLAYHTTAALAPEVDAGLTVIDDFRGSDYGDGISLERASGDVLIRRAYLHDLHDDAVESDWGRHSVTIVDSLFDRVTVGLATRQRKKGGSKASANEVWELRSSLIRLHAWPNTYRMEPGHSGFFKTDKKKKRQVTYRITGNVFFAGPIASEGAVMFPIATTTEECENNVLFWSGSPEAWEEVLDDGDGADKMNNRERLAALGEAFEDCYDVIVKPAGQSEGDFVAEHWTPRANAWQASHAAGG
jgi:hypothetical protein